MIVGGDTGLLIELKDRHPLALQLFNRLGDGHDSLIFSVLSLHELFVYFLRRNKVEEFRAFLGTLRSYTNISFIPVTENLSLESARFRHQFGLATVDSNILTTLLLSKCQRIYTSASEWLKISRQKSIHISILE